ncbi:MAG: hypothetical protein CL816_05565 [Coxiellaceae bacterium]|nr:hypothetical protein [Coxiellaceae bacterium]|tara:strand:- start:8640 stop:9062 length:423 start_codon:yes stop_codon:yes gene_type:complete
MVNKLFSYGDFSLGGIVVSISKMILKLFYVSIVLIVFSNFDPFAYGSDYSDDYEWRYDINQSFQENQHDMGEFKIYPNFINRYKGGCLLFYKKTGLFYGSSGIYARTYLRGIESHYPNCENFYWNDYSDNTFMKYDLRNF